MKIISYLFTPDRVTRETIGHDGTVVEPLHDVTGEYDEPGKPFWEWRNRNRRAAHCPSDNP